MENLKQETIEQIIKVKVLTYNNTGQTVTETYKELTPLHGVENVFKFSEGGSNIYNYYTIVYCISGIYVETSGYYNEDQLSDPSMIEKIKNDIADYPNRWQNVSKPDLLIIELNKNLGNDITEIVKKREIYIKMQEEKEEQKRIEEEDQRKKNDLNNIDKAKKIRETLIAGEQVTFKELLFAIEVLKFNIHPRTKGAILKQNEYCKIGAKSGTFSKKTSQNTAQSFFTTINNFTLLGTV